MENKIFPKLISFKVKIIISSTQLKKASTSLFEGLTIVNQSVETLSTQKVPQIRTGFAQLDSNSPTFHLRAKSLKELFTQTKQDAQNISNILTSTSNYLKTSIRDLNWVKQQVSEIEMQEIMATANSLKKIEACFSLFIKTTFASFSIQRNSLPLHAVRTALIAGASFGTGYLLGKR